jgi:hypothetical protein
MRTALIVSMGLFIGVLPVSAGQASVNPQATSRLGALRPAPKANPYAKLFDARDALKQAVRSEAQKLEPKSTIVCGMTIIEADPYFDQKMKVTLPKDGNVRYVIRAVDPAVCNSQSK